MKTRLLSLAALAALVGVRGASSPDPAPSFHPGPLVVDWPAADGFGGNHYSPLSDITPETVGHLEVAWSYRTGDWGTHENGRAGMAFESTPVMVDGTLYVITPASRAIALDAETGEELWVFDAEVDRSDEHHGMLTSRGLSHWRDERARAGERCATRIVFASYDARLFSLDADTGEPCAEFGRDGQIDLGIGVDRIEGRRSMFKTTAPPAVIGDRIVVGSTIFDGHHADAPSGKVRAFDARTGALLWSWEPIVAVRAEDRSEARIAVGAANTWATITPDPELGLLFVPTSSPSPDHYGGLRPGDNRYANSLVALDAESGQVVWHFQMVHHDLWDYDLPAPPVLVTLERDGRQVPAVVQTTKMGFVFVFDRRTGEPLFEIEERPVPASDVPGEVASPTQPFPVKPAPLAPLGLAPDDAWGITPWDRAACAARIRSHRHDGVFAPPSLHGTVAYPGFVGGMEWGGLGFDPERGLMITNTNRVAMVSTLIPREVADTLPEPGEGAKFSMAAQESTPYAVTREPLLSPLGIPCSPPPWGMIHAVDLNTGELAWERPLGTIEDITRVPAPEAWGSPNLGGPLVTGGLAFIGASMDRRLRAFDVDTGEILWTDRLPASVQSTPMTYRVRPGARQMVIVTAGGHDGIRSSLGDWVVAYALPEPVGADR
jgi:quinoprotein glucose dehydrogenase